MVIGGTLGGTLPASLQEHSVAYAAIRTLIQKLSSQPDLHAALRLAPDGTVLGRFYEFELASGFQPVIRIDTRAVAGYDAYARSHATDGDVISPWGLFSRAADDATLVRLDRLCRLVHTLNYFSKSDAAHPLYLRVHGRLLAAITQDHGLAFRRMIEALGIPPARIVLQLPAEAARDVLLAGMILGNYRKAGFQSGVHANNAVEAQSLLHLHAPDVIKLDLRTVADPERELPALLETAAGLSCQVVFKHVEDEASLARLAGLGAQYAQGYLFGVPSAALAPPLTRSPG
ncbi:MAG: EAL domain-containing protein [Alcaligenaceae bacterium]|nr:EAL domain-containing protein [Alcaligenaceae bacterium SAGV5]MPS51895.1 EAL domain-containing protein [Alcaligenaceae bacterium SAGV3]MPT57153.1 EAL domain-containing protein [Alcaligenaceae bacterium]